MADLDHVREALRASLSAWAVLEVRGDQARVVAAPDLELLSAHLERVDPHWKVQWTCAQMQPPMVGVRLEALGYSRDGLATAPSLHDAKLAALAEAIRCYGVSLAQEGHWVQYDPEDGPNTTDLEAETEAAPPLRPPQLPTLPVRDPQMEKAKRHIEDLLEQLKAAGKGASAARILMRGYGESLEESRQIYKDLQSLLKS